MKTKRFRDLYDKLPADVRARDKAWVEEQIKQMPLNELRHARQLTQETVAGILHVKQATVSKLERQTDMYLSTLRNFIESMGGKLEIRACFTDGDVLITRLGDVAAAPETTEPAAVAEPELLHAGGR